MSEQPAQQAAGSRRVRPIRTGVVSSDKANKSITVTLEYKVRHPKYGKYIKRRTKLYAHDEGNLAKIGDRVEIMECRPVSKSKHWRLVRVLQSGDSGK